MPGCGRYLEYYNKQDVHNIRQETSGCKKKRKYDYSSLGNNSNSLAHITEKPEETFR